MVIEKVKGLLNTAVTWMVVASGILTAFAEEIAEAFSDSTNAEKAVRVIVTAISVLGTAILIVRRVVTVIPEQRQLQPLPPGVDAIPVNEAPK